MYFHFTIRQEVSPEYFFRFSVLCRSSPAHRSVARRILSSKYKRKSGEPLWITAFEKYLSLELV